jgi:hypothetical protein
MKGKVAQQQHQMQKNSKFKRNMLLSTLHNKEEFFLELNYKERRTIMYVDGGHAMAAMSIYKSYLIMEETLLTKEF